MSSKIFAYQLNGRCIHIFLHNQLMELQIAIQANHFQDQFCMSIHEEQNLFWTHTQRCLPVLKMLLLIHTQIYLELLSCCEFHKTPNLFLHKSTLLKRLQIHSPIYIYYKMNYLNVVLFCYMQIQSLYLPEQGYISSVKSPQSLLPLQVSDLGMHRLFLHVN